MNIFTLTVRKLKKNGRSDTEIVQMLAEALDEYGTDNNVTDVKGIYLRDRIVCMLERLGAKKISWVISM